MSTPIYALSWLALLPFLLWRLRSRWQRLTTRQRLSRYRVWIQLPLFSSLLGGLAWIGRGNPDGLAGLALGAVAGGLLAQWGLRLTRFEPTREGLFYWPNPRLGLALFSLCLGRLLYRLLEVYWLHPDAPHSLAEFASHASTLALFGLWFSYQLNHMLGLARWRWALLRAKRQREAAGH